MAKGNIIFSEGSNVNNDIFGKSKEPIKAIIMEQAESFEEGSQLGNLFVMETSDDFAEAEASLTGFHGPKPVGENGAYPVDGFQEGFRKVWEHVVWKNSYYVSYEMAADDKTGKLKAPLSAFTNAFLRQRERFGAAMYGNAMQCAASFNYENWDFTQNYKCADGQLLFSKAHPAAGDGVSQSNYFADEFSLDALLYAREKMQKFKNDDGYLMDIRPNTIVIPNSAATLKKVMEAIGSELNPNTANNATNFVAGLYNVIIWNDLSDFCGSGNPWLLMDSSYNEMYGGAKWFDREYLRVTDDMAPNDAYEWKLYTRFSAGFKDWRFCLGGGIAGGDTLVPAS